MFGIHDFSETTYSSDKIDGHEWVEAYQKVVDPRDLFKVLEVVGAPGDDPAQREERNCF